MLPVVGSMRRRISRPVVVFPQPLGLRHPARVERLHLAAITGTNGKTTTVVLTGRMLSADGREVYIAGNVAAGDGKARSSSTWKTSMRP
jgi:UDP-N-acetylmuramate-alanine ligase